MIVSATRNFRGATSGPQNCIVPVFWLERGRRPSASRQWSSGARDFCLAERWGEIVQGGRSDGGPESRDIRLWIAPCVAGFSLVCSRCNLLSRSMLRLRLERFPTGTTVRTDWHNS